jgi:CRISPR system Cascade subunit CasA
MATNSFNLIDEKWIPTVDKGLVSLKQVFSDREIKQLGGSVIEKLSIFKLLLAIAQSAYTPKDDQDWRNYSKENFVSKVNSYLDKWHDSFFLYSDKNPFLQFPILANYETELKNFSTVLPQVASGNNVLTLESEIAFDLSDADKARILISQMNFAFGGKQTDNSFSLTKGYVKSKAGKVGIGLSFLGYMHSYFVGTNLIESIRLNLLTLNDITSLNMFPSGLGTAPWEKMPCGEDDDIAKEYKQSLLGRLVSLGRFCWLREDGLYLTEGLSFQDHRDGVSDPSVAIDKSKKEISAIWSNPEKSPWRSLPSILSFISLSKYKVFCAQLQLCSKRICDYLEPIAIWSAGQKVTPKSFGEFKVSGRDDSVDSYIWLDKGDILSDAWYGLYSKEVDALEKLSVCLYASIEGYLTDPQKTKQQDKNHKNMSKDQVKKFIHSFWENIEPFSQEISDRCCDLEGRKMLRHKFAQIAKKLYDEACPCNTSKQLKAWSRHQIFTGKYEQIGE